MIFFGERFDSKNSTICLNLNRSIIKIMRVERKNQRPSKASRIFLSVTRVYNPLIIKIYIINLYYTIIIYLNSIAS